MYRTDLIRSNRLIFRKNYNINEDLIFCIEVMQNANKITIINDYYYKYIQHSSGKSLVSKYNENAIDTCIDFMETLIKYYSKFNLTNNIKDEINECIIKRFIFFIQKIRKNNQLTLSEKKKHFEKVSNNDIVRQLYKKTKLKSKKDKIKMFIIMNKLYRFGLMIE